MAGKGNKRTIYLGLDYTNFTGGVTEVNRKMQLLDAEFKLAQQQVKNYGNETDDLGVKQDYLQQKLALQAQKVEAAEKAHREATETNKKSQREIDALAKKLLQEQTAYERLTGQLKETEEAQDEMNDATSSFGDEIRGLAESLGFSVNPAIEKLASKFDGVSKNAGYAIMAVGGIATSLISCTMQAASFADEIVTLSKVTGISTTELQKFQYASEQIDVSVDSLSDGLKEITNKMYEAANGSEETSSLFRKLHVSIKDGRGQLKDANTVFYETIDALGKIKNETQRDAVAMKIFGESARNLNPLIEMGSKKLKELGIEAENMGVIMGETELNGFVKLQDAMDKFNNSTDALKNSLGVVLLPLLTALFESISSIPVPVLQTITVIVTVIATIVAAVKAIKSLTDTGKGIKEFFSTFDFAANKTTLIILGVVAAIIAVMTLIAVLAGKANDVDRAMSSVGNSVGKMTETVTNVQTSTYSAQQHASGTTNFRGGRTWVGEAGPEIVELPPGSRITPQEKAGTIEYNTYYITIDAKNVDDFNRMVQMMDNLRIAQRRQQA